MVKLKRNNFGFCQVYKVHKVEDTHKAYQTVSYYGTDLTFHFVICQDEDITQPESLMEVLNNTIERFSHVLK